MGTIDISVEEKVKQMAKYGTPMEDVILELAASVDIRTNVCLETLKERVTEIEEVKVLNKEIGRLSLHVLCLWVLLIPMAAALIWQAR